MALRVLDHIPFLGWRDVSHRAVAQGIGTAAELGSQCFVADTLIQTPRGYRKVQDLSCGDLVMTRNNGPQKLIGTGFAKIGGRDANAPITILPGALGNRYLLRLAPAHRIHLTGWQAQLHCDADAVMLPVRSLINGKTIFAEPCRAVPYHHIQCTHPEILEAVGLWLECAAPAPRSPRR